MLHSDDLSKFVALWENALGKCSDLSDQAINETLACESGGINRADYFQLCKALSIAAFANDTPEELALSAHKIWQTTECSQFQPLSSRDAWITALSTAHRAVNDPIASHRVAGRESAVANACQYLRSQGYNIIIDAYGCQVDSKTSFEIAHKVDGLVRFLGGEICLNQIFRILHEQQRFHDGFWLFGDILPSAMGVKDPTLPYAWLIRLALGHLGKGKKARKPEVAWRNLVNLATNFAACLNFERYSQWENLNVDPGDLGYLFQRSVGWQQLFMLKQIPPSGVDHIYSAMKLLLDSHAGEGLGFNFADLHTEVLSLLKQSTSDRVSISSKAQFERVYPTLCKIERENDWKKCCTSPFGEHILDHEKHFFFQSASGDIVVLPTSITGAAACRALVELVWKKLGKKAEKLIGDTFEKAVVLACAKAKKTPIEDHRYHVGKENFQIDVAVREDRHIALFEVKAKALTDKARQGNTVISLIDYGQSFAEMIFQLARHEKHIRLGQCAHSKLVLDARSDRLSKIAVSALSHGPVGDKVLGIAIISALSRAEILPVENDPKAAENLKDVTKLARKLLDEIAKFQPLKNDQIDLHSFMFDVKWLDIGELSYVLGRAANIENALAPIRAMTFSSRDVWTEIAIAERSGLTAKYWKSL